MLTTIEVLVEELCTRTVAKTPIITPHTGLLRSSLLRNTSPAAFPTEIQTFFLFKFTLGKGNNFGMMRIPPSNLKAELRKSREQKKIYKHERNSKIRMIVQITRPIF